MGLLIKFKLLSLEKKLLIVFLAICIALPFVMVKSPLEVVTHSLPLWVNFQGAVGLLWVTQGKPIWQAAVACYGISTVELLILYLGGFGIKIALTKLLQSLRRKLMAGLRIPFSKDKIVLVEKRNPYQRLNDFTNHKKTQFTDWLKKRDLWVIFLFLLLPLPVTDILAALALGAKELRYGHWYLAAVNLPHMFLVIYLLYVGVDFLFIA